MSEVEILLLGTPRIERAGAPLRTDTRKATALLTYLAVTGEPASRDRLSDLLWPETNQTKARAALRRTLSALSEARSEGWLLVERETVALDMERVYTDVAHFRALLSKKESGPGDEARLSEAVELYRDDFMAGFSLRDSAVFDDWQFFEGENLRNLLANALERLSWIEYTRGDWEAATAHARRWLSLDRLHEPAHRRLMEVHARAGRRSAALKQYSACRRILSDELGVSPLEATTRLYDEIRRDALPPLPDIGETSHEPPGTRHVQREVERSEPSLFGRETEWEELIELWENDGGIRVVVIEGEAGIGKTRLTEEFLSHVSAGGAATLTAHCYESERNIAYGPFIQMLATIDAEPDLRSRLRELSETYLIEASRLTPKMYGDAEPPSLDTPGARSRFFEGVSRVLASACSGTTPGVLFVDDVHLCDTSSLELLAYLTRRLQKLGDLRLILTSRTEEVRGDHPVERFLSELRRSGTTEEIHLGRLDRETVEEMVATIAETSPQISRKLFEESEGVPLFVGEYLRAISTGVLPAGDEKWTTPGGVRDVVLSRLTTTGETARQVLGAAAVVGRSFDFDAVHEASGRGEEEVLEAIEELTRRALISEVRSSSSREALYDFSHGQLRDLVYEETSLARRRILHRRLAEYLSESSRRRRETDPASARIAYHYRLAGRDEEAAHYYFRAGEEARRLYANAEALSHFETALSLGHPETSEIHEEIGDLRTLGGEYEVALRSYETSLSEAGSQRSVGLERKLGDVYQRLGDLELAEAHYRKAIASLTDGLSLSEEAMLRADLSLLSHGRGDSEKASRYAGEALRLAEDSRDTLTLARAHNIAAMVSRSTGESDEARRHLERSLTYAVETDDPPVRIAALNNLALFLGESGEMEEAVETAGEALELCEKLGDRHREAAIRSNLADLFHIVGEEEKSREHFRRAVEIFSEIGGDERLRPGIWRLVEW